jgi:hypothetical protein
MPLHIDEVHTDVQVAEAGASAGVASPAPPEWASQEAWRLARRQEAVDRARTWAWGNDSDGDAD